MLRAVRFASEPQDASSTLFEGGSAEQSLVQWRALCSAPPARGQDDQAVPGVAGIVQRAASKGSG